MKVYRYELKKENKQIGILVGLDDFFNIDEILSVCDVFEMKLKDTLIPMQNTKSYFTEKGNRKFRKGIRKIKKLATNKDIEVLCEVKERDELSNIIYEDNDQIVINMGS